jgi:menaquinone-9 beta-reductase
MNTISEVYDVAVIGGGLAGCSTAIALARRGWKVALFESKAYPHHKVCGEFLSPECETYFAQLGIGDAIRALHPAAIHAARITTSDGEVWDAELGGTAMGLSRYELDAAMAEHAQAVGAQICNSTTVTQIHGALGTGFTLETRSEAAHEQVAARVVIAAHGKRGVLDRALERPFLRRDQPFVGLKAHFRGQPIAGRVELHAFEGGYCGMSEIENGAVNVCLLVRSEVFQRAGDIEAFVAWMRQQNTHLDRWLRGAEMQSDRWLSISQIPFIPKCTVEQDVLMVGDAAGLIAPLAGNGMSMALQGGLIAAACVDDYLAGRIDQAQLKQTYSATWERTFTARLRLGRWLQACMFNPRLLHIGLHVIKRIPALGRFLIRHTRDKRGLLE